MYEIKYACRNLYVNIKKRIIYSYLVESNKINKAC